MDFLRAAYKECKCEVKVGDMVSESFDVGLRQGCALLPVLFSLYINSLVDSSAEKQRLGLNVEVILANDDKMLRRVLNGMGEWCVEWSSVKVYVDKCGIMHVRKKGEVT